MGFSKIALNNQTMIDLTSDTVVADKLAMGHTAHDADGELIAGTATFSGETANLGTKSITANGTYNASSDSLDGYSSVTVNVASQSASLQAKTNITPTTSSQTITPDTGYYGLSSVQVNAMPGGSATTPATTITANPSISVSASGLITATTSASQNVTPTVSAGYVSAGTAGAIGVTGSATEQLTTQAAKTVTPTESEQTAVAANVYTTGVIKVSAISDTYVGSAIDQNDSTDLTVLGATVTGPSGYYAEGVSKSVASGSATTPATTITANPSIDVNASGLITATASASQSVTPTVSAGYVSSGTGGTITVSGSNTSQLATQAATTITPTESEQIAVATGKYTTGEVKVGAISSTYVGSGITQRDDTDLTASGSTVTVPAGHYASQETKSIASGTEGTPTANKGTVSNHSISITPSVTNTAGYISGGTHSGTAATVSASELVSGTLSITDNNDTKDVTNYASVNVAIPFNTVYTGSSDPSSSAGTDGDIYIKVVS